MLERGWLAAFALALAACSFDSGGVADDTGDDAPDGPPGDSDGDGMSDLDDNCPDDPNPEQEDEDADEVGNVCDNCPHVDNADQTNDGEVTAGAARDGSGDACDPFPSAAGNDVIYFEGFDDSGVLDDWTPHVVGNWTVEDGALRQSNVASATTWIYMRARQFASIVIDVDANVEAFYADGGFGTLAAFSSAPGDGAGYACITSFVDATPDSATLELVTFRGSASAQIEDTVALDVDLAPATYTLRESVIGDDLGCSVSSTVLTGPASASGADTTYPSGFVGLRTETAAVRFPYVIVFSVDG